MKLVLFIFILFLTISCTKYRSVHFLPQEACVAAMVPEGVMLSCPGQDPVLIENGQDGADGQDGIDGQDGADSIVQIVDPCGDDPGEVDEVLLVMHNGTVLAWFKNVGLVVLQPGASYQTTDKQKCNFSIDASGNVSY